MESNWIEIKRFLKDYKKNIFFGSAIIAIIFTILMYVVGIFKTGAQQEGKEDFEVDSEEILNDAQPAYFQIYVEYEDGTAYGNPAIINQYFNLTSIKEQIKKDTGIDIQSIEEEVFLSDLSDQIEIINVTRNDSSYLLTATFNLGSEQDNLLIAEYYYNLLYSEDFSILEDKKTYVFQEPMLTNTSKLELEAKKLEEIRKVSEGNSPAKKIFVHLKNTLIGLLLGVVATIGILLLKTIFGKTLDYSFAYDFDENDNFILYDEALANEKIISQFVAAPFSDRKPVVSEVKINNKDFKLLIRNGQSPTNNQEINQIQLDEFHSLTDINWIDNITEVIIIIYPRITTREWYRTQKWLAEINELPMKVIQINQ